MITTTTSPRSPTQAFAGFSEPGDPVAPAAATGAAAATSGGAARPHPHAHPHGRDGGDGHRPAGDGSKARAHGSASRLPVLPWSLFRLSLGERLAIAAGLSAAIWGAVLWALTPVAG